ncbi:MAG: helix-turn-helix domain-containing protein [Clostridia bacterium]|nr:helix-turn-helix domain-containing protein [Clostridia bacterium]
MNIIKELRRDKGYSQRRLAQLCSVHQTAVSQWETGRTVPERETLITLSQVLGVSVDTILGNGELEDKALIPVLGYVRAGVPAQAVENVLEYEEMSSSLVGRGEYFGLKIRGDSMFPMFHPDDTVIVRRQPDAESGDIAVVHIGNEDAVVKKLIKKDTSIALVSENSFYEPMLFTKEEVASLPVTVIGKVVELRRKF